MSTPDGPAAEPQSYELMDAVVAMSSDHDLPAVLNRVVTAARDLTGARYAALGVLSETAALLGGRRLAEFHTDGIAPAGQALIGPPPTGKGVLGVLIDHPEPLRLTRLGDHPASVGFPPNHPPMSHFLGVPVRAGTDASAAVFGNLYLTDKADGTAFDDHDLDLVCGLAAAAGVAIENARLLAESRNHQRWSAVTATLVPELVKDLSQAPTLVARALVQAGSCDAAGIALAESDQLDGLVSGARRDLVVRRAAGVDLGLVGQVIDFPGRARILGSAEQQDVLGLTGGASVVVGCATADRMLGALVLHRVEGGWSRTELASVDRFADDVARAVEHARYQHNWQLLAVYTDRDRIARDLHDLIIQRVFAVGLGLQGAIRRVDDPAVRDRLRGYVDDLDATIAEIRSTIFSLHRTGGTARGLRAEVVQVVQDSAAVLGFDPRITVRGEVDGDGPALVQADVVAALREGLANVIRHARARTVAVLVEVEPAGAQPGLMRVRIEDDGIGVQAPADVAESGLANLRARAALLGGSVEVGARVGGGTVLTWQAPVPR